MALTETKPVAALRKGDVIRLATEDDHGDPERSVTGRVRRIQPREGRAYRVSLLLQDGEIVSFTMPSSRPVEIIAEAKQ